MSYIPPRLSEFARRVLLSEADKDTGTSDRSIGFISALDRACVALHDRLAPLISSAGFQTLMGRAVQLAGREFPFLAQVTVATNTRCSFSGLPLAVEGRTPEEIVDALSAVLSHFIWLLVIFIGENLGLLKVRELWPDVPFDKMDSSGD